MAQRLFALGDPLQVARVFWDALNGALVLAAHPICRDMMHGDAYLRVGVGGAMKRKSLMVFAAIAVGIVLLIILMRSIAATPNDDPGGWRSAVRKYIDYQAKMTGTFLEVAAAEQAARPWEFRREMSIRSFGTSTYYSVDVPFTGRNGSKPLHLPPVEVWCIQLKGRGESESEGISNRLVLVAKHQDLYNADWITHIPPDGTSLSSAEILALIGCRRGRVPANPQQTFVST